MPQRPPIPNFTTSERSKPQAVGLGAGKVASTTISPSKAHGQSIFGLHFEIKFSMTQSAAANWKPSQLFDYLLIEKGSNKMVYPQSYAQLVRLFNSLTSLADSDTIGKASRFFNDPQSAGAAGTSTSKLDFYLPLTFNTQSPPLITLGFLPYTQITNGTAGSATITVTFMYSPIPVIDDQVKIVKAPTALAAGTDIDVSAYFGTKQSVKEAWIDVVADANLDYQAFNIGQIAVFDKATAFELRALTTNAEWMQPIDGFLACNDQPTKYSAPDTNANAKQELILNLLIEAQPTFYLFLAPN
jgi:hypothetical protein